MISHSCFAPERRALGVLVVLGVLAATPSLAQAQTEAQKQEAKDHYAKGRRLYDVGKYMEAIDEYQKVYFLTDDPNMLFNIGQCYRLSDRPEEAVRFFRNYLRRAPATASNRADVETKIAALEKVVEERKRTGVTSPPPASGQVTAPPVEPTPPPPPGTSPPGGLAPPPPPVL